MTFKKGRNFHPRNYPESVRTREARYQTRAELALAGQLGPILSFAKRFGNAGVIAVNDTSPERFVAALQRQIGTRNVLPLVAWGSVQGEDLTTRLPEDTQDTATDLGRFRERAKSAGVVVVEATIFNNPIGSGSPSIHDPLYELIRSQEAAGQASAQEPPVIFLGKGRQSDLLTHPDYHTTHHGDQGIVGHLATRFALDGLHVSTVPLELHQQETLYPVVQRAVFEAPSL